MDKYKNLVSQVGEAIDENNEKLKEINGLNIEYWKQYKGEDRVIPFAKKMADMKESIAKNGEEVSYKSGYPSIDKMLGGLYCGQLVVVSGETASGKSQLLINFTNNLTKQKVPCLWFSYELSTYEFLKRFGVDLPSHSFLPNKNIESNLKWLREKIIEGIVKYNTEVVFIDHLHYLIDLQELGRGNSSLIIGGLMRELKKLAVKLDIVIFIVAHTAKMEAGAKMSLSSIRDSSLISQESDIVLMIAREKERDNTTQMGFIYTNKSILVVAKNRRRGVVGDVKLEFDNGVFKEQGVLEYKGEEVKELENGGVEPLPFSE